MVCVCIQSVNFKKLMILTDFGVIHCQSQFTKSLGQTCFIQEPPTSQRNYHGVFVINADEWRHSIQIQFKFIHHEYNIT